MAKGKSVLILCILLVLFMGGCNLGNVKKDTREIYNKYVAMPADVDISEKNIGSEEERKMAMLFSGMDKQIHKLVKAVGDRDVYPDDQWFEQTMEDFSWINGVAAVTTDKEVLRQIPETPIKVPDYTVLFDEDIVYPERGLRSGIDSTPLGPEIYLGSPFFRDNDWAGLLVVHFDIRSLLSFSPHPEDLLILYEGKVIWPGENFDAKSMETIPWQDILRGSVFGDFTLDGRRYFWVSRYLGQARLIYAIKEEDE